MKFTGDYHLHTPVSDGHSTVREYAMRAVQLGLEEIAITDHSFCSFACHQTIEKFDGQHCEIEQIRCEIDSHQPSLAAHQREEFDEIGSPKLSILQGVEGNILDGDGNLDVPDAVIKRCDILIAGFHRFLMLAKVVKAPKFILINGYASEHAKRRLKELNTAAFIGAIEKYPIDVISHIGHRTPLDFVAVCRAAKEHDTYIELNAKHILSTKGLDESMNDILATGVRFIVGTDAHRVDKLGGFDSVEKFIAKHNIPLDRVYGINGNNPVFKDKSGWTK